MKQSEIKVGGYYLAKVSEKLTVVKALKITEHEGTTYRKACTTYLVLNMKTGREVSFRSAMRFRREARASELPAQPGDEKPVDPKKPGGVKMGELFGRKPEGAQPSQTPQPAKPVSRFSVVPSKTPSPRLTSQPSVPGKAPLGAPEKPGSWLRKAGEKGSPQPEDKKGSDPTSADRETAPELVKRIGQLAKQQGIGQPLAAKQGPFVKPIPMKPVTKSAPSVRPSPAVVVTPSSTTTPEMKKSATSAGPIGSRAATATTSCSVSPNTAPQTNGSLSAWMSRHTSEELMEALAKLEVPDYAREAVEFYNGICRELKKQNGGEVKGMFDGLPPEAGEHLLALHQNALKVLTVDAAWKKAGKPVKNYVSPGDDAPTPLVAKQPTQSSPQSSSATAKPGLAAALAAGKNPVARKTSGGKHMVVVARAGTGKTFTLIGGAKKVSGIELPGVVPSDQQAAIWDTMMESRGAKSMAIVCFNKPIAEELKTKVPPGCRAQTNHSLGSAALRRAFKLVGGDEGEGISPHRVSDHIEAVLGKPRQEINKETPGLMKALTDLVALCKQNLVGFSPESKVWTPAGLDSYWAPALDELAGYYGIELATEEGRPFSDKVYTMVPQLLERGKDVRADSCIDFNDMIWLPVVLDLPVFQNDLLMVDEAQDLNRCQQALVRKAGRRIVMVGDPKQAIYGFAGADVDSIPRMLAELGETPNGVAEFPLNVTRRCGRAIVKEAQRLVPDFYAHESNGEGKVTRALYDDGRGTSKDPVPAGSPVSYHRQVQDNDMVLCRVNAPLVSQCFRFIRMGRTANIQGRDIGKGISDLIDKLVPATVQELVSKVDAWKFTEMGKENARRNPSESRLIAIGDKADCIISFTEGANTVHDVKARISEIFTDDRSKRGIKLSSIHKAKGLEADRVFFLRPPGAECPHPLAKSDWEIRQELNLEYVAITRAKEELVYVT